MSEATITKNHRRTAARPAPTPRLFGRIAVCVDGHETGRDAVALGSALAAATGSDLLLITVNPEPLVVLPTEMNWKTLYTNAEHGLREVRRELAPVARIDIETDLSVARGLNRAAEREHRDVIVVGSSRHADVGRVRLGKHARQLLYDGRCAIAVAPRGLHQQAPVTLRRIGVGYDGGPESRAALELAAEIACCADAKLHVRTVVNNRMPALGWGHVWTGDTVAQWQQVLEQELDAARQRALEAARGTGPRIEVDAVAARPAAAMRALSSEVDLVVIGSRRWGAAARLVLGTTGEALMHDASCPVVAVPRPPA